MEQACFAAGPFAAVQQKFNQLSGVKQCTPGYTGGDLENPSAEDVAGSTTGHAEAVLLEFEASEISYQDLCRQFLKFHDPTQLNRQGDAVGNQYRSAIFYVNEEQRSVAEQALIEYQTNHETPIVTVIEPLGPFYQA